MKPEEQQDLIVYRIVSITVAVMAPVLYLIVKYINPLIIIPAHIIISMSAFLLVYFTLSFIERVFEPIIYWFSYANCYLITCQLIYLLLINSLAIPIFIILLIAIFIINSLIKHQKHLLMYNIVVIFLVTIITVATTKNQMTKNLLVTSVSILAVLSYIISSFRLRFVHDILAYKKELFRYECIANLSNDYISLIDTDYVYQTANDPYIDAHRKKRHDIVGKSVAEVWGDDTFRNVLKQYIDNCFSGVKVHYQAWFDFSALGLRFMDVVYNPFYDNEGIIIGAVVTSHDLTEQKRVEEQLLHHSLHDSLTGLPNRSLFNERLKHLLLKFKRSEKIGKEYMFAVLFLDIDGLHIINDSYGPESGDALLIQFSRRMEALLRDGDTIARHAGDEFTILMDDIADEGDVIRVANRIHDELKNHFTVSGHNITVTASIGIALSTSGYDDPDIILRDADIAMYRAKEVGKSRYEIFDKELHQRLLDRITCESELREALEKNEFRLVYQPIVDCNDGTITGVEALIRWQNIEQQSVSPIEFIHIAEETGLIIPIGEWVLKTACIQMKEWIDKGYSIQRMSVNCSAQQFKVHNFSHIVKSIIDQIQLKPENLELEVTESIVIGQNRESITVLKEIQDMGVNLSIDDFGTGYSSLSYLKELPIDRLKIDRLFIKDINNDPRDLDICTAIISLARSLKIPVVAEGIETKKQLNTIRTLNCEEFQGYYASKPAPPDEIEILLKESKIFK